MPKTSASMFYQKLLALAADVHIEKAKEEIVAIVSLKAGCEV